MSERFIELHRAHPAGRELSWDFRTVLYDFLPVCVCVCVCVCVFNLRLTIQYSYLLRNLNRSKRDSDPGNK